MSKRVLYNITSASLQATNISGGTINATTFTGGNLSLSGDLKVAGTLTTVNITSTNLVNTNVSAGVVVASTLLSATGNSNTIGSIFTTGGNVGIGTTNPSFKLDVAGSFRLNSTAVQNFVIGSTSGTTNNSMYLVSSHGNLQIGIAGGAGSFNNSSIAGDVVIRSSKNLMLQSGELSPNLYIATSGNIGIGTTAPGTTLDVSGTIRASTSITTGALFSTNLTSTNVVATNVSAGTLNLSTGLTTATARMSNLTVTNISSNNITVADNYNVGAIQLGSTINSTTSNINLYGPFTDGYGYIQVGSATNTTSANLRLTRWGTNNATIANFQVYSQTSAFLGGNVGIGTTAPGATLDVSGTIRASGTISATTITGGNLSLSGNIALLPGNRITTTLTDNFTYSSNVVPHYGLMWATDVGSADGPMAYLTGYGGIRFFTLGAPRMLINASGNVGIGTTSPQALLHLHNTSMPKLTLSRYTSNISGGNLNHGELTWKSLNRGVDSAIIRSTSQAVDGLLGWDDAGRLEFLTSTGPGALTRMVISESGNVGIGTTAPAYTLDVNGTIRASTSITTGAVFSTNITSTNVVATNISGGTISATTFTGANLSLSGDLKVAGTLTTVNITSTNLVNTNVSAGVVVASTLLSATGNSNTIGSIFTTGGNVGIGTTAPNSKLHVVGLTSNLGGTIAEFKSSGNAERLQIIDETLSTSLPGGILNATGSFGIGVYARNGPVRFFTTAGNLERMRVTETGNVGIGTTAPAYTLDVTGSFRLNSTGLQNFVIGSTSGTANHSTYLVSSHGNLEIGIAAAAASFNNSSIAGDVVIRSSKNLMLQSGELSPNLYIATSGNIGIGTTAPAYTLDVNGTLEASNSNGLILFASSGNVGIGTTAPAYTLDVNGTLEASNSNGLILFASSGNVGIGTTAPGGILHLNNVALFTSTGNLTCTGDIISFGSLSDIRLKKDVESIDIEKAIDVVSRLRGVTFKWREDVFNENKRNTNDIGFIAQEIEKIIPEAVSEYTEVTSKEVYKNIKHERIIPYLLVTIQYLLDKINK